jgi:site-specific recombinase XerD
LSCFAKIKAKKEAVLMRNEMQIVHLSGFKEYLVRNGYSNNVIPRYIRKVKEFWESSNVYVTPTIEVEALRKSISEYLANIPLCFQKDTIHAALHTYYHFITGNRFFRRLYATDFEMDISIETEIERFRTYLNEVAQLSNLTVTSQCNTVKVFLYSSFPEKDYSPQKMTADRVRIYLTQTLRHVSAASKKTLIVRIRSYVRFLAFTDGFQSGEILKLPMTTPVWKRAELAKYLTDEELDRLFSTYDQTHPTGVRNYAIARCLRDLGLRCSEVAGLSLDDFDWIQGTVTIKKTKSHSERILPLHVLTGRAIEAYVLHSRPATQERILFVRFKNKQGHPMGASQVRHTVRQAAIRAELAHFTGTHILRHTVAKELINQGIDLKTIADILGHESVETTCMYTKLNFTQLQDVAGTWPEVRA